MSIHKQDLPKNSAPGFNLCLFLSLSHSLHFSLPHILRLAQAWLLGSCSSLPSQRQLALLSYFINYVNDVLLSVPATEHHQVPPLNACKWACLQAWTDLRLSPSPQLTVIRSPACQAARNPGPRKPRAASPMGQLCRCLYTHKCFWESCSSLECFENLHFLTWTWSSSQVSQGHCIASLQIVWAWGGVCLTNIYFIWGGGLESLLLSCDFRLVLLQDSDFTSDIECWLKTQKPKLFIL